ncbi:unnamed protein product [Closterium sp. Yama58-4]|nr:unnamed protein product [Closterium sp. Yama58-4]
MVLLQPEAPVRNKTGLGFLGTVVRRASTSAWASHTELASELSGGQAGQHKTPTLASGDLLFLLPSFATFIASQELYAALESGDLLRARAHLAEDVDWWFHGPKSRQLRCMQFLSLIVGEVDSDGVKFMPVDVTAKNDKVISEGVSIVRTRRGALVDVAWVHVWTVSPVSGRVTGLQEFVNTAVSATVLGPASGALSSLPAASCREAMASSSKLVLPPLPPPRFRSAESSAPPMDAFPEELLTPPVPLVALLGVPELHVAIAQYLQAQSPPVASVFVPDRADAAEVSGKERRPADAKCAPPLGVLKAEWVKKHRERIPAAAVVLVEKALLCGDAGAWQSVCAEIDQIKSALRGRNVKLVLLLVQATAGGEMSEERLGMLKRRAEVDGRGCIPFLVADAEDQKRSLSRLYAVVVELCANYYRDEVRRMRLKIERRAYSHTELTVRYYFKMGMYCEFRREWLPAVKCYEAAFLSLQELFSGASERYPLQTVLEVKAVAEVLSLKVCTLLLHSGREVEAVGWFRTFMEWFRARVGPPEAAFLHWGWMARQYEVFGELLQQRLASSGHVVGTPADTFGLAALGGDGGGVGGVQAGAFGAVGVSVDGLVDVLAEGNSGVEEPVYVGQACRLVFRGHAPHEQRPTDQEVLLHEVVRQRSGHLSGAVILLHAKAHDLYRGIHAQRMMAQVSCDMAREYLCMHDYPNAKLLLDAIAQLYRRDSFPSLLAFCLLNLRSCARHLSLLPDFLLYSLELCTLPALPSLPPSSASSSAPHGKEEGKVEGTTARAAGPAALQEHLQEGRKQRKLAGAAAAAAAAAALRVGPTHPFLLFTQELPHLRAVLSATAAFPPRPTHPPSPPRMGQPVQVCVSLLTHFPIPLRLQRVLVRFSQSCCDTWIPSSGEGEERAGDGGKEGEGKEEGKEGDVGGLVLQPGVWKRLSLSVTPDAGRDGDSFSAGAEGSGEGEGPMPSESQEQSEASDSELPLVLGQGESFTQLFHVTPRVASPSLVIGSLLLTWQRHAAQGNSSNGLHSHGQSVLQMPAGMANVYEKALASGFGIKLAGSDPDALTLDAAAPPDQPHQQAAQTLPPTSPFLPQLSPTVSSLRPFPPVLSANPILVASLRLPPFTIVGSPFSFSIRLSNCTTSLQEVVYQLQDAPGFVFAGQHSGSVTVLPRASLRLSFRLVAVASGMLQLPLIRLLAPRPAAKLYPCLHTSRLFVFPSAAAVPAAAAAGAGSVSKGGMMGALLLQQS